MCKLIRVGVPAYVTKEDKSPVIWGEYSLAQVLELARRRYRSRRKSKALTNKGGGNASGADKVSGIVPLTWVARPFSYRKKLLSIFTCQILMAILNLEVPPFFLYMNISNLLGRELSYRQAYRRTSLPSANHSHLDWDWCL